MIDAMLRLYFATYGAPMAFAAGIVSAARPQSSATRRSSGSSAGSPNSGGDRAMEPYPAHLRQAAVVVLAAGALVCLAIGVAIGRWLP